MSDFKHNAALALADDLVADGKLHFTFAEACERFGQSTAATGNLLSRMIASGLVDRVRYGHYVIRKLGVLGKPAAAEDVSLAVGSAFVGIPHRMAYRTALDEHDLIVHPSRSIYVASNRRIRAKTLSGRTLHVIHEPGPSISIGAIACGLSWVSSIERAILDAAMRPNLVGGAAVLAGCIVAAANSVDVPLLTRYAQDLGWAAALRRIGSIADTLDIDGLAGRLRPIKPLTADLDLEPGPKKPRIWRDSRWRIRWPQSRDEIASVAKQ